MFLNKNYVITWAWLVYNILEKTYEQEIKKDWQNIDTC